MRNSTSQKTAHSRYLSLVCFIFVLGTPCCFCKATGGNSSATRDRDTSRSVKVSVAALELLEPVKRELNAGATDTYEIKVRKGQFLRVVTEQEGIDVVIVLCDPTGKVLVEADSPNGTWGPEPASTFATVSGIYKVQVKSSDKTAAAGKYAITVTDLRGPKAEDRKRIAAESALFAANKLGAQASSAQEAVKLYDRAALLWHAVGDAYEEGLCLEEAGVLGASKGEAEDNKRALDYYERALPLFHEAGNRRAEAEVLQQTGALDDDIGDKEKAVEYYERSLTLYRETGNSAEEAQLLNKIGAAYHALGKMQKALEYDNRALQLERTRGDSGKEAGTLVNIGLVYANSGQMQMALDFYNQALPLERSIGNRRDEAEVLNNIGQVYDALGEKQKALEYYNQVLPLARAVGERMGEAATLMNIGGVYQDLGEQQKTLECDTKALEIARELQDRGLEAKVLANLGGAYQELGEKQKALEYDNQAVTQLHSVGDHRSEATVLSNMGFVYHQMGDEQKALEYYNLALPMKRELGDRGGEAATLASMGIAYAVLGDHPKALDSYTRALTLERETGARSFEAATLGCLGATYAALGEKQAALDSYYQALGLSRAVRNPSLEGKTLQYLMGYWAKEKDAGVAIFFGKQSVNAFQQIRRNIQGLDSSLQRSFLESKANVYRELGDLLISQGRLAEAQQVLDLLKEQEYFEFVRGGGNAMEAKNQPVTLNPEEQNSHEAYEKIAGQITALGAEFSELRARRTRTAEEEARFGELKDKLTLANQEMGRFFKTLYVEFGKNAHANQSAESVREETSGMQSIVRELGPGTVALYTLVGDTHYSVIVITASTMQAREYPVAAVDLRKKVATFLEALRNPASDPLAASQELYKILFAPIAEDLKGAKAQTLMWSLNDVLRYVPMAALHDGKQYLVESYRNVVITPASISRLKDKVDVSDSSIAGMGVSKDYDGLGALAAVPAELRHIVRDKQVPGATGVIPGTMMLDDDFTETHMAEALDKHYPVVHIASHFVLQAGNETNSYLLLGGKDVGGKGYHLTLAELRDDPALTFDGTELLTLSACQTGASGTALNGREVDGLGITAQQKGAKAVLASLWSVADESTALLMADFYRQWLEAPGMTKAGALQQVQLDMLHGAIANKTSAEHGIGVNKASGKEPATSFSHPFYWAPFILIGNWK